MGSQGQVTLFPVETKTKIKRFITEVLLPTETYELKGDLKSDEWKEGHPFQDLLVCQRKQMSYWFFKKKKRNVIVRKLLLLQRDLDSEKMWENEVSISRAVNSQFLSLELKNKCFFFNMQCVLIRKWANNSLLSSPPYCWLSEAETIRKAKFVSVCTVEWQHRRQHFGQ